MEVETESQLGGWGHSWEGGGGQAGRVLSLKPVAETARAEAG